VGLDGVSDENLPSASVAVISVKDELAGLAHRYRVEPAASAPAPDGLAHLVASA